MDIRDPYKVLGVSPGDSDEDIARAYRKLAKKYHPDLNPGNKAAEEKMKEINAAYDIIKNKGGRQYGGYESPGSGAGRQGGYGNTYEQEGPFGWFFWDLFGGQYQQRSSGYSKLEQAATLINNGQYSQALSVLAQINDHDAQWHYMSAVANAGLGNRVTALSHAKTAAGMEPGNHEYQELVRRFEKGSYDYRQAGKSHGFGMQGVGRTVWQMLMAQLACMFCCRPC